MKGGHTISWSIKPEKKSINFGIFKHPGSGNAPTPKLPSSTFEPPVTPGLPPDDQQRDPSASRSPQSTAVEKLQGFGLKSIYWYGSCEASRVSTGYYDVPKAEGGMYALVFDNTFSKQLSKKATFVLLTYPTDSPPQISHHQHHEPGLSNESTTSLRDRSRPRSKPYHLDSSESVKKKVDGPLDRPKSSDGLTKSRHATSSESTEGSNFFSGVLQKRRRKKHQGWARRFFSLNYSTSTLSYYHDRNTVAIRGSVPLSLAAIGANAKTRQISIDSGAEIWHLKASNDGDFLAWKRALELARTPIDSAPPVAAPVLERRGRSFSIARPNPEEERDWARAEALLTRVEKTRDVAKTIAKDTDPKYLPFSNLKPLSTERLDPNLTSGASSNSESPSEPNMTSYFTTDGAPERRPFWKRKPSSERPVPGMFRRSVSATPATTPGKSNPPTPGPAASVTSTLRSHPEEGIHDHCMVLLRDLDSIVSDFAQLLQESKHRRTPATAPALSRQSIDSQGSDEFFDAEGFGSSQLLAIQAESDDEGEENDHRDEASGSDSEYDESGGVRETRSDSAAGDRAFPPRAETLPPLPTGKVKRRVTVPPCTVSPPSLIGFFRKNVGKDLSAISMPVSANEPISLVQRLAETLEYSQLLDSAAVAADSMDRLIYVTAFAISMLSNARAKERAIRKPFNPMLGETFELVREDKGFRFLAEKVSHRPVRLACQAESLAWCFIQSPMPSQKFWGKSAEIITEGKFRVRLHSTGDYYSWTPATTFLRNIIAGEKYVEPVGSMDIVNERTRERAVVTFRSKGMFSGRIEDVFAQLFDRHSVESSLGLTGKWTTALTITENGCARSTNTSPIWTVRDLVPDPSKRYGFTTFAASLNEITSLERGKLPPTDSRLRPDQRAAEDGDLDRAEVLKTKLEEAQRVRRKDMEDAREVWRPRWFERLESGSGDLMGEEVWIGKTGGESYWEKRQAGDWRGVNDVFGL